MAILYFKNVFTLGAGQSMWIKAWINGEGESGGEYRGPVLATACSTNLHERLTTSTVEVEFTARNDDGLTSKCFYWYLVTNNNPFPVSFTRDMLTD